MIALALTGCALTDRAGPAAPGIAAAPPTDQLAAGHRLMEAGEPELALDAYLRAAIQRGLDVEVLAGLGSANLQLGRLGQAERLLRRAIEEDPTFAPAWNNLGVVLIEQDRAAEAVPVFARAATLDSGETAAIGDNLELARSQQVSQGESAGYPEAQKPKFAMVRRGAGNVLIRRLPD